MEYLSYIYIYFCQSFTFGKKTQTTQQTTGPTISNNNDPLARISSLSSSMRIIPFPLFFLVTTLSNLSLSSAATCNEAGASNCLTGYILKINPEDITCQNDPCNANNDVGNTDCCDIIACTDKTFPHSDKKNTAVTGTYETTDTITCDPGYYASTSTGYNSERTHVFTINQQTFSSTYAIGTRIYQGVNVGTLSNVLSDGTSYTEITVAAAVRVYFDTNNRLNIGGIRTYTFTLSVSQDITAAQGASVTQGDNTGTLTTALTGATTTVTITVAPGVTLVDNIDLVLDITTTTTTTTTTIPNADISAPPTLSASNGGTQVIGTDIIKVIDLHATGTTTCQTNGKFDEVTCTGNPCVENRKVAFSDQSNMVGGTGQSKVVTCNQGYKILGTASDATASVICQPNGAFEVVECIPVPCTAGLNIPFSNYKAIATHTFTVAEQLISENQNVIVTQNSNIGYLTTSVGATGSTTTTITITTNISEVSFVTDQNLVVGTTTIDKDDIFSVVNNGVETSSQLTGVTLNEVEVMCDSGYHASLV